VNLSPEALSITVGFFASTLGAVTLQWLFGKKSGGIGWAFLGAITWRMLVFFVGSGLILSTGLDREQKTSATLYLFFGVMASWFTHAVLSLILLRREDVSAKKKL